MTTVTPILEPPVPPKPVVTGVVIELDANAAKELLMVVGGLTPSGGWVGELYNELYKVFGGPPPWNTKFTLDIDKAE